MFLAAISPGLSLDIFCEKLEGYHWQAGKPDNPAIFPPISDPAAVTYTQGNATMILRQNAFVECLQPSDLAIAMAGTATEQYVGLGKPAFAFPGVGPQFTPAFAAAQSRLLGPSLILLDRPTEVAIVLRQLLRAPDRLQLIADNGLRRMGEPGAASRIVACLSEKLLTASG